MAAAKTPKPSLKIVTPAAAEVVTLAQAKRHVRAADFDDDDTYLQSLIDVATSELDGANSWLGRALLQQTWDCAFDKFPCDEGGQSAPLYLPLPPLISVTSVNYTASDGSSTALTSFRTFGAQSSYRGYITPALNERWPATKCEPEAVRVRFVAGFGAATTDVPAGIRHAILLMVGHWYKNREDSTEIKLEEMPMASKNLLDPYRAEWH